MPRVTDAARFDVPRAGSGQWPDLAVSLTPLQRMLVSADGTLTRLLEAYAGEAIAVVKLHQFYDTATDADAAMHLGRDATVLRRRVLLCGRHSERCLLYAEAVIAPERVDPHLLDGLLTTDKPIGQLLAESRCETLRDILAIGVEPAGACGRYFGRGPDSSVVARTYSIVSSGRPIMLITERFPMQHFRELRR